MVDGVHGYLLDNRDGTVDFQKNILRGKVNNFKWVNKLWIPPPHQLEPSDATCDLTIYIIYL